LATQGRRYKKRIGQKGEEDVEKFEENPQRWEKRCAGRGTFGEDRNRLQIQFNDRSTDWGSSDH